MKTVNFTCYYNHLRVNLAILTSRLVNNAYIDMQSTCTLLLCIEHCCMKKSKRRLPNSVKVNICWALYDNLQWKSSTLATLQRISLCHHRTTIYNDSSKKPSSFYVESTGKLNSSSNPTRLIPQKTHTALSLPRTPSDRRIKRIWRRHAQDDKMDEIQESKQLFPQQAERRYQTH